MLSSYLFSTNHNTNSRFCTNTFYTTKLKIYRRGSSINLPIMWLQYWPCVASGLSHIAIPKNIRISDSLEVNRAGVCTVSTFY